MDRASDYRSEERKSSGTWCTMELEKAVEKGYRILKIHEVFHFRPENRRTGLFADYVNTWSKLKQSSAGWPSDCVTPEEKTECLQEYIQEYREKEGIADNPGRKAIVKLLLSRHV